MLASIIIRALNESRHLDELLRTVAQQETAGGLRWEVVLVDSGSTDGTLEIAKKHQCHIIRISREEFSFGHSLNIGCEAARGDILVMISGHCVPIGSNWLQRLCRPIMEGKASYVYGRQVGGPESYFSECRIFAKYYPESAQGRQNGFFCNNANSAIARAIWEEFRFNEELTGLEDMELAKRIVENGGRIEYLPEACVHHHHQETWTKVQRRFEREAIALQRIMPQVHIRRRDLVRYIVSGIFLDWRSARSSGMLMRKATEIVRYRIHQYWGSYKGNRDHRMLSHKQKELYFYPDTSGDDYDVG